MAGSVEGRTCLVVNAHFLPAQRIALFKLRLSASTCSHAWLQRPLSLPIDEKKLQALFSQYGRVIRVRLRYCQTSLAQKESAYVEFADEAAAAKAIRKPPWELNGKKRMAVTLKGAREQRMQQLGGVEQGHRDSPSASAHTVLGKRLQRSDSADEEAAGDVDADQPSDAPGEEDAPSGSPKRRKGVSGSQQQELKAVLAALTAQAQERVALVEERAKNEQLVQALQEAHQARDGAVVAERRLQAQVMQQKQEAGMLKLKVEQAQAAARAARDEAHQVYGRRLQDLEIQRRKAKHALLQQQQPPERQRRQAPTPLLDL